MKPHHWLITAGAALFFGGVVALFAISQSGPGKVVTEKQWRADQIARQGQSGADEKFSFKVSHKPTPRGPSPARSPVKPANP